MKMSILNFYAAADDDDDDDDDGSCEYDAVFVKRHW